jgi:glycine betaine/proline transport system permease protein
MGLSMPNGVQAGPGVSRNRLSQFWLNIVFIALSGAWLILIGLALLFGWGIVPIMVGVWVTYMVSFSLYEIKTNLVFVGTACAWLVLLLLVSLLQLGLFPILAGALLTYFVLFSLYKESVVLLLVGVCLAFLIAFLVHMFEVSGALEFAVDIDSPITNRIDLLVEWLVINLAWFFDSISDNLKFLLGKLRDFLVWVPWPVIVATVLVTGWRFAGFMVGFVSAAALALIGAVDLWESAMVTVAIMLVSVAISVILGLSIGVLAAKSNLVDTGIRPLLDGMQTMPAFVYLVPGIMFFGLGNVPAVIATVLYSLPPCIRLTNLGIRQVDPSVVEAGRAFGSSRIQLLTKVQIPLAVPTIMAGINQTVMLALAMATIAAMVGAGGLGRDVLLAMGQLEQGDAFIAGVAIVILAIIVDRISQGYISSRRQSTE